MKEIIVSILYLSIVESSLAIWALIILSSTSAFCSLNISLEYTPKGSATSLVEIDRETESRKTFGRKVSKYIEYFQGTIWKKYFRTFPTILTICLTQRHAEDLYMDTLSQLQKYGNIDLVFKFTTMETMQSKGIGEKIWKSTDSDELDWMV